MVSGYKRLSIKTAASYCEECPLKKSTILKETLFWMRLPPMHVCATQSPYMCVLLGAVSLQPAWQAPNTPQQDTVKVESYNTTSSCFETWHTDIKRKTLASQTSKRVALLLDARSMNLGALRASYSMCPFRRILVPARARLLDKSSCMRKMLLFFSKRNGLKQLGRSSMQAVFSTPRDQPPPPQSSPFRRHALPRVRKNQLYLCNQFLSSHAKPV